MQLHMLYVTKSVSQFLTDWHIQYLGMVRRDIKQVLQRNSSAEKMTAKIVQRRHNAAFTVAAVWPLHGAHTMHSDWMCFNNVFYTTMCSRRVHCDSSPQQITGSVQLPPYLQ